MSTIDGQRSGYDRNDEQRGQAAEDTPTPSAEQHSILFWHSRQSLGAWEGAMDSI